MAAPVRAPESAPGSLDVVMIASEAHPFATTGGLAEVVGALPRALARLGHTVTIIIPRYRRVSHVPPIATTNPTPHRADAASPFPVQTSAQGAASAPVEDGEAVIDFGGRREPVTFYSQPLDERLRIVFVDAPDLFDREGLYGTADRDYPDNAVRFALFSRAALEYIRIRGRRPSVIHTHDWQTGLVAAYQKMLFSDDPVVGRVPAVFTIHNLAFQGVFPASTLAEVGLPWDVFNVQAMEFWGQVSFLKAGINFSERITTVSPTYAKEILSREAGFGMEGVLARRAEDLCGILNGIDITRWNPATDEFVPAHYDAGDLAGKTAAKRYLLETAGLPHGEDALRRPLIGIVSRLTDQKGFDLIAAAADELMTLDAAWVMLGDGDRRYEDLLRELASRYPDRVSATIPYQERLEHLIEAGADAFLMPSRFEPCGLNQLNSLRYGTLPIVRATGGLDDTVTDASDAGGRGTGFKFEDYTPEALVGAVRRALEAYRRPESWRTLQRRAMEKDYSWDVSAREYVKVYRGTW